MLLLKYFQKRAKDGLPDPNRPLSAYIPSDDSLSWPTKRYPGIRGISAELAPSEGKKRGPYNR